MTNLEFSSQFDILYNNISSNAAPPVDEYEKSVFLTIAEKDIVIGIYNGREIPGISFESTEEARRYLSTLIKEKTYSLEEKSNYEIDPPQDLLFIVKESAVISSEDCLNNKEVIITPTRQDNLQKILNNPFRGPNNYRVLRVDSQGVIKLYSKYKLSSYNIAYIKIPEPIITDSLEGTGLSIEGKVKSTTDINPVLHRVILERAVHLAKEAYIGK